MGDTLAAAWLIRPAGRPSPRWRDAWLAIAALTFASFAALRGVSAEFAPGRLYAILGDNGAGKTTTVRMLAALIAPTDGDAIVAGHTLGVDDTALRGSVGILTEQPGLYDRLSARQNLRYFARLYDLDPARADSQVERYLHLLELWDRRDEPVGTFSKGMRQKLAIARALLHEPSVVFLDEPTAALDPEAARTVRDFVKGLKAEGRTIFLTTHNLPEADELCDSIGIFQRRLLRMGSPDELRAGLFGAGTVVRVVGDGARGLVQPDGVAAGGGRRTRRFQSRTKCRRRL